MGSDIICSEDVDEDVDEDAKRAQLAAAQEDIDGRDPKDVVFQLQSATVQGNAVRIEACFKRLRELCRSAPLASACIEHGALRAVIAAERSMATDPRVGAHALGAMVNLCSSESPTHRDRCVAAGAVAMVVDVMRSQLSKTSVQEMGCLALQNCCFGDDKPARRRREAAASAGAIGIVVDSMVEHESLPMAQLAGLTTLGYLVQGVPQNGKQAAIAGKRAGLPAVVAMARRPRVCGYQCCCACPPLDLVSPTAAQARYQVARV